MKIRCFSSQAVEKEIEELRPLVDETAEAAEALCLLCSAEDQRIVQSRMEVLRMRYATLIESLAQKKRQLEEALPRAKEFELLMKEIREMAQECEEQLPGAKPPRVSLVFSLDTLQVRDWTLPSHTTYSPFPPMSELIDCL